MSDCLENQVVDMTYNNYSAREIAKKLGICHRTVLQVKKRKNISPQAVKKSRPCLLSERDARTMERLLSSRQVKTPKQAAAAINKPVSEWTARRALRKIGLISAVKQKKPALSEKKCEGSAKIL